MAGTAAYGEKKFSGDDCKSSLASGNSRATTTSKAVEMRIKSTETVRLVSKRGMPRLADKSPRQKAGDGQDHVRRDVPAPRY